MQLNPRHSSPPNSHSIGFRIAAHNLTEIAMTHTSELTQLRDRLRDFAAERDWEQFHSPKNLSMALMVETAELMEHFQWLTEAQSNNTTTLDKQAIGEELADVLLYLVRLADRLDVDLLDAATRKIEKNAAKYPAEQVRGSAKKYSDY
jgi:NTP pyrophosphatase (non-canonical NTP hydrolase)